MSQYQTNERDELEFESQQETNSVLTLFVNEIFTLTETGIRVFAYMNCFALRYAYVMPI